MVTAGRLQWTLGQLALGRQSRLRVNTYVDKVIVHIYLLQEFDLSMKSQLATGMLWHMLQGLGEAVAIDHGHSHSSGECHITIVLKSKIAEATTRQDCLAPVVLNNCSGNDNNENTDNENCNNGGIEKCDLVPAAALCIVEPRAGDIQNPSTLDDGFVASGLPDDLNHDCDVPAKSWDRKDFRQHCSDMPEDNVARVWVWIGDRYLRRYGKKTLRCDRLLEGLSEKELLAAMEFVKNGDELHLALPLFKIAHQADVETEPSPQVNCCAASSSSLQSREGGGFQLAGINKRGMAQSSSQRKKR